MTTPTEIDATADEASRTSRAALLFGCVAVGAAIKINGGNYHPAAVALVGVALVAALAGAMPVRVRWLEAVPAPAAAAAVAVGLAVQLALAFAVGPLLPPSHDAGSTVPVYALLVGVAACVAPAVRWAAGSSDSTSRATLTRVAFPLALALHFAAGVAAIRAVPYPMLDFYVVQELAGGWLLGGGNPYAMTFPDLTHGTSPHWDRSLMAEGQLQFGFLYPPLSLFCLLPVQVFTGETFSGDFRYANAAAVTAAGALIGYCRPGPWPKLAAGLFLLTPAGMLVVAGGWTESLVALMLALTVFAACRRPAAAGGALGLWWAIKQYVPLTAPLALLLAGRPNDRTRLRRMIAWATAVGAVVTLPLALWDVKAFWHSAVAVQLRQPFRPDSLSVPAAVYDATGVVTPAWVAFVALAAAQAVALWRAPRTPAGFAAATGFALLAFFAFSKQAFANYYFLVTAALAAAAAAASPAVPAKARSADGSRGAGGGPPRPDEEVQTGDTAAPSQPTGRRRRQPRRGGRE